MYLNQYLNIRFLPLVLMTAMLLTRFQHFNDVLHLPDASLAVFYFAGFYRKVMLLGILMGLGALIDYIAVGFGASGACISPAYVFLIPAYAGLWIAGRYSANLLALKSASMPDFIVLSLLAASASIAFIISNGGFYLFSGGNPNISWTHYWVSVAGYYPPYLSFTLIYGVIGLGFIKLAKAMPRLKPEHKPAQ
jgi:hypothetical protein